MDIKLTPADSYTVFNNSIITEFDKKVLISLYEPIIGPTAVSLYFSFCRDLDALELTSNDYSHHHLSVILKSDLKTIESARKALEAIGLLKTYLKKGENLNEYLYELYSPLSPSEFLNHPVLSVLLLNNVGTDEYNHLISIYKKPTIRKDDFEEITSTMNKAFKVEGLDYINSEDIRDTNKSNVNIEEILDFDLICNSIPNLNEKVLNKKTRELLNQLAYVYKIDNFKMMELIRLTLDENGSIDKDKIRMNVRRSYEFDHNGRLPTIVYRTQPDHLKTPTGDMSNKAKMVYVFENTMPYDFLKSKNHGVKPTSRELQLLEKLAVDYSLPPGVINVLIDYSLKVNGNLSKNYIETIAADWQKKKIVTVPQAMDACIKKHTKVVKQIHEVKPKKEVETPIWMNQEQNAEVMTEEEIREMEALFSETKRS
jgi:replication initiation and membrane attachment protein